jgi:hypothetical protein
MNHWCKGVDDLLKAPLPCPPTLQLGDHVVVRGVLKGVVTGLDCGYPGDSDRVQVSLPDPEDPEYDEIRFFCPCQLEKLPIPPKVIGPRVKVSFSGKIFSFHPSAFGLVDDADPLEGSKLSASCTHDGEQCSIEGAYVGRTEGMRGAEEDGRPKMWFCLPRKPLL